MKNMPDTSNDMHICDFGAGTGYLSIVAALRGAKFVTAIEKDAEFRKLMLHNFSLNSLDCKVEILESSEEFNSDGCLDYIFCNPACYPSIVGESSFYYAGDNGLDMIEEVFKGTSGNMVHEQPLGHPDGTFL